MSASFTYRLFEYLQKRKSAKDSAFTLVELIVVVVIIGILSAIAIPSFQNASDKAKQKEASTLLAAYTKAAQAFYTEYSQSPANTRDLGQYISITGCSNTTPTTCKTATPVDHTNRTSTTWNSPSGYYSIRMERSGTRTFFRAIPAGQYAAAGFGVSSCFNSQTGASKLTEMTAKGSTVGRYNC